MHDLRQQLKKAAPDLFNRTPVLFAYLYRPGKPRLSLPDNDFNIGVYVEDMTPGECLDFEISFSDWFVNQITFPGVIEVRVLTQLSLVVKGEIIADSVLIYSRDDERRIRFENQIRELYFDLMPAIEKFQSERRRRALSGAHI